MLKRRLKEPFGKAGLTVAIVALVMALVGGAYAASGPGDDGKATASAKKAKKGKQGKPGKNGKDGAPGAPGANGTNGKDGAPGANGAPGADGAPGVDGKTVLNGLTTPSGSLGTEGDFYIRTSTSEIYGPKTASGWGSPTSLKGETGFTDTLPAGKEEKGKFISSPGPSGAEWAPISFSIPLAADLPAGNVHRSGDPDFATACPGSEENPTVANNSNLCVYVGGGGGSAVGIVADAETTLGASKSGAFFLSAGGALLGSWAVKGP